MGLITAAPRPNQITEKKDRDYHRRYVRWILGDFNQDYQQRRIMKSLTNWCFYAGNQWIFDDDLESFLMDDSGEVRNRLRLVENIIRPIVGMFKGNAIRLTYDFRAFPVNENCINRMEDDLNKLLAVTNIANMAHPLFRAYARKNLPIGATEQETKANFENIYVDKYTEGINDLCNYVARVENDFDEMKVQLAPHIALNGMGIIKSWEQGGRQRFKVIDGRYFMFDYGAKLPDLTDGCYMGEVNYSGETDIYERWQDLTDEEREMLARYATANTWGTGDVSYETFLGKTPGRIPVYEMYWKDVDQQDWGYVVDDYGYEKFVRLNDDSDDPWTEADLIMPKNKANVKRMGGKMKKRIILDVLRYCFFTPGEIVGSVSPENPDIIYEWGIAPYQETSLSRPSSVAYPYKAYCWEYSEGEVFSPVDDAIDPQRLLNRIISVNESKFNNSRGSGTVIDSTIVDPEEGEEGVVRNMNANKPIFVRGRGNLNNALGTYNATGMQDIQYGMEYEANARKISSNTTGVNEAMVGTNGGNREAVGVQQALMARGSLMQEPFFYCLGRILMQAYQCIATQGKMIYCQDERVLSIATGTELAKALIITKDYMDEDFGVAIQRTMTAQERIQEADTLAFNALQLQLLDDVHLSQVLGRGDTRMVYRAIREYVAMRAQANQVAAQQEKQQADAQNHEEQTRYAENMKLQYDSMAHSGQQQSNKIGADMAMNQQNLNAQNYQSRLKLLQQIGANKIPVKV